MLRGLAKPLRLFRMTPGFRTQLYEAYTPDSRQKNGCSTLTFNLTDVTNTLDLHKRPIRPAFYHVLLAEPSGESRRAFERKFEPDILAVWRAEADDFADLHEHMHGRDPGGVPPPTAAAGTWSCIVKPPQKP